MSSATSPFNTLAIINDLAWALFNSNPRNQKKRIMQPQEISSLLRNLHDESVQFLLIGGFAMAFHGFPRATGDIDLWIKNTPDNMMKLREALVNTGFAEAKALRATTQLVAGMTIFNLMETDFRIDLLHNLKLFKEKDFDMCYQRANDGDYQGIPIKILNAADMLDEKKLANREKDTIDISYLQKMLDKLGRGLSR